MKTFKEFIIESQGDTPFHKYSKNTVEELELLLKHHKEDLKEGDCDKDEILKDIKEIEVAIKTKDNVSEAKEPITKEEFMENVKESFHKHFPNGFINLDGKSAFSSDLVACSFGMIGNIKDNNNGISQNDKMYHKFMMFANGDGTYKFEGSGRIYINPAEGSYNAMDSVKTKMGNNSKITFEKAEIKMTKFFKKLSGLMKDNVDNIYGVDKINKKYLVFK